MGQVELQRRHRDALVIERRHIGAEPRLGDAAREGEPEIRVAAPVDPGVDRQQRLVAEPCAATAIPCTSAGSQSGKVHVDQDAGLDPGLQDLADDPRAVLGAQSHLRWPRPPGP